MHITAIEATAVRVPLPTPVYTASGTVWDAPLVLVDVRTDAGVTGHAYVFTYTPMVLAATRDLVLAIGALAEGMACDPLAARAALESRFRLLGSKGLVGMALAGIDMAVWDAAARHEGLPLARLLGAVHEEVRAYLSLGMDGAERGAQQVEQGRAQGFRAFKVKLGYPTLEADLAVLSALRAAAGRDCVLMADYNQSLSVDEALRRCSALDELGLGWIEEPVRHDDDEGHALIAAAVRTPIQLGENWFGTTEMKHSLEAGAGDLAMPDLMKIGGISGWMAAARLAQRHGRPVSSHLFQEASAHALSATPTAHFLEVLDVARPVLREPLQLRDGKARVLDAPPGSGVEWDYAAVQRFRI